MDSVSHNDLPKSGQSGYRCSSCDKTFHREHHLARHERSHHTKSPGGSNKVTMVVDALDTHSGTDSSPPAPQGYGQIIVEPSRSFKNEPSSTDEDFRSLVPQPIDYPMNMPAVRLQRPAPTPDVPSRRRQPTRARRSNAPLDTSSLSNLNFSLSSPYDSRQSQQSQQQSQQISLQQPQQQPMKRSSSSSTSLSLGPPLRADTRSSVSSQVFPPRKEQYGIHSEILITASASDSFASRSPYQSSLDGVAFLSWNPYVKSTPPIPAQSKTDMKIIPNDLSLPNLNLQAPVSRPFHTLDPVEPPSSNVDSSDWNQNLDYAGKMFSAGCRVCGRPSWSWGLDRLCENCFLDRGKHVLELSDNEYTTSVSQQAPSINFSSSSQKPLKGGKNHSTMLTRRDPRSFPTTAPSGGRKGGEHTPWSVMYMAAQTASNEGKEVTSPVLRTAVAKHEELHGPFPTPSPLPRLKDDEEHPSGPISRKGGSPIDRATTQFKPKDQMESSKSQTPPTEGDSWCASDRGLTSEECTTTDRKRLEIIENVMRFFVDWLDTRLGVVHDTNVGSEQIGGRRPENAVRMEAERGQPRGGKRKLSERTDGSNEEDDDILQPRQKQKTRAEEGDRLKFACPYFKHNQRKYRHRRPCCGPGWDFVHRIK
jgi:hypothetical protein